MKVCLVKLQIQVFGSSCSNHTILKCTIVSIIWWKEMSYVISILLDSDSVFVTVDILWGDHFDTQQFQPLLGYRHVYLWVMPQMEWGMWCLLLYGIHNWKTIFFSFFSTEVVFHLEPSLYIVHNKQISFFHKSNEHGQSHSTFMSCVYQTVHVSEIYITACQTNKNWVAHWHIKFGKCGYHDSYHDMHNTDNPEMLNCTHYFKVSC